MDTYPRWSLDSIYSGLSSDSFTDNINLLYKTCEAVCLLASDVEEIPENSDDMKFWLSDVVSHLNMMVNLYENLESYAYCRFSVDTRDKETIDGLQRIEKIAMKVKVAKVAITNALASHAEDIEKLCAQDARFIPYAFILTEMIENHKHLMSPELESLAADLQRAGGDAWRRLQESISSTATAFWDEDTGSRKSVIELRALAFHHDRAIRERAFRKEIAIWKEYEIPLASALNGVKGFSVSLDRRRSYASSLDRSVSQSRITQKTLDTLIEVLERAKPLFTTYLRKKAQLLGLDRLAFYDLFAPVGEGGARWSFEDAKAFIIEQFSDFYTPMGEFASYAFEHHWIDAQPDVGKVGGAYCIHFPLAGESRVLCNFDGSFSSVSTVAHELGHAFHGDILKRTPGLLRDYPMTLAETASIFAEAVIFNGALRKASDTDCLPLIESFLMNATQTIIDILSRFYFEQAVFAGRQKGELTVQDFCALMIDAQKKSYGDGLDPEALHPYMWAVKGHYYNTDLAYYNYPYAFGQLFGMGLYAQYLQDGDQFCERYVKMLQMAGSDSAVAVTAAVGFDIETTEFWQQGIDLLSGYVERFCSLADEQIQND